MTSDSISRDAEPAIPILLRYVQGWPKHSPEQAQIADCLPFEKALARSYPDDYHFVAYAVRFVDDTAVRLTTEALAPENVSKLNVPRVEMQLLVVDVDDPIAHDTDTPARAEWREVERAKCKRLHDIAPGVVGYETRGGYRLMWRLRNAELEDTEDVSTWRDFYAGALAWLKEHADIEGDASCKDWTRIYRLPNVEREGKGKQSAAVFGALGEPWPLDREIVTTKPTRARQATREGTASPNGKAEPKGGAPAIVEPLISELSDALEPTWNDHNHNGWRFPFLGWLAGKGWSLAERAAVLDLLAERDDTSAALRSKYDDANKRVRPLDGVSDEVRRILGDDFDAVDRIVAKHPASDPLRAKRAARGVIDEIADSAASMLDELSESRGKIEGTIANVATILKCHEDWAGVLGYDEFARSVLALKEPPMREQDAPNASCIGPWTDAHTARARAWIATCIGVEPGKDATDSAVDIVARAHTFHPVREYLAGLAWDGTPRLDRMLQTYFGVQSGAYAALVGSKFMIAAVARVMSPGCKVDTILILEGPQGSKKSTAARVLAGEAWFADTALDFDSKDAAQCLQGKWIYEFGELHSFNRSEVTRIKAFISSPSDNLRPSYGRRNEDFPRQCVFIGTTNDDRYLTDTTGNRRYWPVKCGSIDVEALRRERDQLWAEAAARHAGGERWWLDGDEERLAAAEQSERESEDPWESVIAAWLAQGNGTPRAPFTMAEVLANACQLAPSERGTAAATRAGKLLARLGYKTQRKRGDGTIARVYFKPSDPTDPTPIHLKSPQVGSPFRKQFQRVGR